jgi:hypothetical protein
VDGYDVGDLVKSQTMREFTINTKILTWKLWGKWMNFKPPGNMTIILEISSWKNITDESVIGFGNRWDQSQTAR